MKFLYILKRTLRSDIVAYGHNVRPYLPSRNLSRKPIIWKDAYIFCIFFSFLFFQNTKKIQKIFLKF